MYVCMFVYVCVHIEVQMHTYIQKYRCMCTYRSTDACVHTEVQMHAYIQKYRSMRTYRSTDAYVHPEVQMHAYMQKYRCIRMYVHTYTYVCFFKSTYVRMYAGGTHVHTYFLLHEPLLHFGYHLLVLSFHHLGFFLQLTDLLLHLGLTGAELLQQFQLSLQHSDLNRCVQKFTSHVDMYICTYTKVTINNMVVTGGYSKLHYKYIHTYVRMYVDTYVCTYVRTYTKVTTYRFSKLTHPLTHPPHDFSPPRSVGVMIVSVRKSS